MTGSATEKGSKKVKNVRLAQNHLTPTSGVPRGNSGKAPSCAPWVFDVYFIIRDARSDFRGVLRDFVKIGFLPPAARRTEILNSQLSILNGEAGCLTSQFSTLNTNKAMIKLAAYQKELIRTGKDYGMLMMLWRRQGGKTTTFAWQALRWMLEKPGTLVTFATCSLALGSEMTEREALLLTQIIGAIRDGAGKNAKVESNADNLEWYDVADLYQHNRLELSLYHSRTTRSRTKIIAANYATARGYSGYVLLDEVGFIRDFKSFYEAIEPVFSRNPDYRLWMATTPPEDDGHFTYELTAPPPGKVFLPAATGNWYTNESGLPVHRVSADDAERAGIHLFHPSTRQPITPAEHRAKALDKTAWDRNYGLIFTQGGTSAVNLIPLNQAQSLGAEYGCIFAEDELPTDWHLNLDPNAETAVGADPATTENEKSNPFGIAVTQLIGGKYVAKCIFRFRSSNPVKCRMILKDIIEKCHPKAVAIDATSERFWAAETKMELEPLTHVELIVNSERTEYHGESITYKTYLGNLAVSAIEDRQAALPQDKAVKDDFRLVKRYKGGFDNECDNAGHHGDTFDAYKNSIHALLLPINETIAEAVPTGRTITASAYRKWHDTPPEESSDASQFGIRNA